MAGAEPVQALDHRGPFIVERAEQPRQQFKQLRLFVRGGACELLNGVLCLLDQVYIHNDKQNVAQALKEAEGKVGGPIKVTGFVRYKLGEGVEKQESDFAAEVAAAAGTKN